MSDETQLGSILASIEQQSLPPVDTWQPPVTRDIDIRIARNGDWFYQGSHIQRQRMVKLFSRVLRQDGEETFLVTPQERLRIQVEDAPFTAVLLETLVASGQQTLVFTTNLGDRVIAGAEHPVTVRYEDPDGEPSPYVLVRGGLQALISRTVFCQLAELAEERDGMLGVASNGFFMPLQESDAANRGSA